MDITLRPNNLFGAVTVPPSKSIAHRMLICAAFSNSPTTLICPESSEDIDATEFAEDQLTAVALNGGNGEVGNIGVGKLRLVSYF